MGFEHLNLSISFVTSGTGCLYVALHMENTIASLFPNGTTQVQISANSYQQCSFATLLEKRKLSYRLPDKQSKVL